MRSPAMSMSHPQLALGAQNTQGTPSRRTALIVEDDPSIARLLLFYVREAGFQPVYASDGLQGLALAARHRPALVLLDVMMPGLNGWEVCEELRRISDVPIIMLTSKNADQDVTLGLNAGADDYITKPFSGPQLVARIQSLMRRSGKESGEAAHQRQLPFADPTEAKIVELALPPDHQPAFPGTRLRRARRAANLSLLQAERSTGIRWDYLQALEQDEISTIPANLRRQAITVYAEFVGLDPAMLWEAFAEQHGGKRQVFPLSLPATVFSAGLMSLVLVLLLALYMNKL